MGKPKRPPLKNVWTKPMVVTKSWHAGTISPDGTETPGEEEPADREVTAEEWQRAYCECLSFARQDIAANVLILYRWKNTVVKPGDRHRVLQYLVHRLREYVQGWDESQSKEVLGEKLDELDELNKQMKESLAIPEWLQLQTQPK